MATKTWIGSSSTDWFAAGNWILSGVAGGTDDVVILTTAKSPILRTSSTVKTVTGAITAAGNALALTIAGATDRLLLDAGPHFSASAAHMVTFGSSGMMELNPGAALLADPSPAPNAAATVTTVAAAVSSPTLTTLVSFNGANGASPLDLIVDGNGDLFGTTSFGGANGGASGFGDGTVFEIAKTAGGYASTPTTLLSFNGTNGNQPQGGLIADAAGDLLGTTSGGGAHGNGTVFEIAKTAGGYASTPTTLVSFNGTDGSAPYAGVIADSAGDLFGTTLQGGVKFDGNVFEIVKSAGGYAGTPNSPCHFQRRQWGTTGDRSDGRCRRESVRRDDGRWDERRRHCVRNSQDRRRLWNTDHTGQFQWHRRE